MKSNEEVRVPEVEKTGEISLLNHALQQMDPLKKGLAELATKYKDLTADATTTAGMTTLKEARAAIREGRYKVPHILKDFNAKVKELKDKGAEVGQWLIDEHFALENPIHAQIESEEKRKEAEKAERERIKAEAAAQLQREVDERIEKIRRLPRTVDGKSIEEVQALFDKVEVAVLSEENYPGANLARAEAAKGEALDDLRHIIHQMNKAAQEAEEKRVNDIRDKIVRIKYNAVQATNMSIIVLEEAITELDTHTFIGDTEYMEFRAEAMEAKTSTLQDMRDTLAEKKEAKRVADEAAEQVKKDRAELAEQKRVNDEKEMQVAKDEEARQKEAGRVSTIKDMISRIKNWPVKCLSLSSTYIRFEIEGSEMDKPCLPADFAEFTAEAEKERIYALATMESMFTQAKQSEEAQAEIDRQNAELKRQQDAMAETLRKQEETAEVERRRIADNEAALQAELEAAALAEEVEVMQDGHMAEDANDSIMRPTVSTPIDGPEMISIMKMEYERMKAAFREISEICRTPDLHCAESIQRIIYIAEEFI